MPDSTSAQPILDAAEQAAVVGDIDAAEQLLRQAVHLQETHLGPRHPDLANTLNNLGVVCEKTGRLDEAESCYRRAYEIAAAAFDPGHPFVITSRKNLADFCEARGEAIDPPAAAAAVPSASPPPPVAPSTIEPATQRRGSARCETTRGSDHALQPVDDRPCRRPGACGARGHRHETSERA